MKSAPTIRTDVTENNIVKYERRVRQRFIYSIFAIFTASFSTVEQLNMNIFLMGQSCYARFYFSLYGQVFKFI